MRAALKVLRDTKGEVRGSPTYIYDESLDAAAQVLLAFRDAKNGVLGGAIWALLVAVMQCGKTGVIQAIWLAVMDPDFVHVYLHDMVNTGSVVVVSGTDGNDLRNQTAARIDATMRSDLRNSVPRAAERTYHNKGLQGLMRPTKKAAADAKRSWNMMRSRCIIIIDESHHGQNSDSTVAAFLQRLGVSGDGDPAKVKTERSVYVLSISATPMSEVANMNAASKMFKKRVVMRPGAGYVGPREIVAQGRVRQAHKLDSVEKLQQFLNECGDAYVNGGFREEGGCYVILRQAARGRAASLLGEATSQVAVLTLRDGSSVPVSWHHYNSKTRESMDQVFHEMMTRQPHGIVIVIVQRMLGQGDTFSTRHVAIMYDTAESNTDVAVQSFFGRACGYRPPLAQRVIVYSDVRRVEAYCKWVSLNFGADHVPQAARNMVLASGAAGYEYEPSVPVFIANALSTLEIGELKTCSNRYTNVVHSLLRTRWVCQAAGALDHLLAPPYDAHAPCISIIDDTRTEQSVHRHWDSLLAAAQSGAKHGIISVYGPSGTYGPFRYQVIVDARSSSKTMGSCIIAWRGSHVQERRAIPASEAMRCGYIPRSEAYEMFATVP
jgi:hypothetical protein